MAALELVMLDDYLAAAEAEPWVWGRADCVHFAGDWILAATGRDPLARYRGLYGDAMTAARMIAAGGGLAALVAAEMGGFARRQGEPEHGDVAVVETADEVGRLRPSAVICAGPWWVGKALNGVMWFRAERPAVVWTIL